MIIIDFISAHPILIFLIVIIIFLLYQFFSWYKKGGKQRIEAIKKTVLIQKEKIMSGESTASSVNDNLNLLKDNLYK